MEGGPGVLLFNWGERGKVVESGKMAIEGLGKSAVDRVTLGK